MERTLEKSREETRNHTEESEAKDTIIATHSQCIERLEEELTSVREFTKEARTELRTMSDVANRRVKEETEREREAREERARETTELEEKMCQLQSDHEESVLGLERRVKEEMEKGGIASRRVVALEEATKVAKDMHERTMRRVEDEWRERCVERENKISGRGREKSDLEGTEKATN